MLDIVKEIKESRYCVIDGGSIWGQELLIVGIEYQAAAKELNELIAQTKTIEEHLRYQRYIETYYNVRVVAATEKINKLILDTKK